MKRNSRHQHLDKDFLKRNDLAVVMDRVLDFISDNRGLFFGVVTIALVVMIAMPIWNSRSSAKLDEFNRRWYLAGKGLTKDRDYQALLADFSGLPAARAARLDYADVLIENQNPDQALKVVREGLVAGEPDLISTLLVLKVADILKSQKKYTEAADFLEERENAVISEFRPRSTLLRADLFRLAGEKQKAETLYKTLTTAPDVDVSKLKSGDNLNMPDPNVAKEAREHLQFLEAGLL